MPEILTQEEIEALLEVIEDETELPLSEDWEELKPLLNVTYGTFKNYIVNILSKNDDLREFYQLKITTKSPDIQVKNFLKKFIELKKQEVLDIKIINKKNTDCDSILIDVEYYTIFPILKNVEIGKIYKHYYKNNEYFVLDFCQIQINDEWKDAVIYQKINSDKKFVRELEEFRNKFY